MASIKKLIELDYPNDQVTQPVLSELIKTHGVTVNIRRASISKGFGYVQMEIEGEEAEVLKALAYLRGLHIDVNPITKDIVE
jgi:ABC-type methionine transport system ATPase subunit